MAPKNDTGKLNIEDVQNVIIDNYNIGMSDLGGKPQPIYFEGLPGVGKSAGILQAGAILAAQLGLEYVPNPLPNELHAPGAENKFFFCDWRLSQDNPVDLKGLVARGGPNNDQMIWLTPERIPSRGKGIILYDEINQAPKAVSAAAFQGIHDRAYGSARIPDGWAQVAAGNPASARGVYTEMPPALANRFVILEVHCDPEEWINWAYKMGLDSRIMHFLEFKPGLLHRFDPAKDDSKSFPSPRSWEAVHRVLKFNNARIREMAIQGAIGNGASAEFNAFLKNYQKLPDIGAILDKGKIDIKLPSVEPSVLYALTGSLTDRLSATNAANFCGFLQRTDIPKEFQIMGIRHALKMQKNWIKQVPGFQAWLIQFRDLLI